MQFDFITIVSGLPRSGTSLMMQMLAAGGFLRRPMTSARLMKIIRADIFEFEPVKRLRTDRAFSDSPSRAR